jgi:murein DD-endopeptidase MepM/ murein hydrolase activator NlpD
MAPIGKSGSTSSSSTSGRSKTASKAGSTNRTKRSGAARKSREARLPRPAPRTKDTSDVSRARPEAPTAGADTMAQSLATSLSAQAPPKSTLSKGMNSPEVKGLQKTLNEKLGTNLKLDGDFGANTQKALRQFQQAQGLTADGVAGPKTWAKLGSSENSAKQPAAEGAKGATSADEGKAGKFRSPIPGAKISSNFGPRKRPKAGASKNHKGVDIRGPIGTPVGASQGGVVTKSGRLGKYGNIVEVRHPDGTSTRYAHLNARDVKVGQKVKAGQEIGQLGQTGNVTGPHLHFEIRDKQGNALNPMDYLRR